MPDVLGVRALNRALLARQLLLRRRKLSALDAIEHLVGMQAQIPNTPYIGLWTRLHGFRLDDLTTLVHRRRVVRVALMRSTIHLVTARDCLALRRVVQPAVERGLWSGSFGRRLDGINRDALAAAGRALVDQQARTFTEIGKTLAERWRGRDPLALAMAVRALVPLVQVPPRGIWGSSGPAAHVRVEAWLNPAVTRDVSTERMILRYLKAFGPASVRDMQAWSGVTGLRDIIERLRQRLRTFRDEKGQELFDVPHAPLPHVDSPAPPRFLPEFDNVLLSHADRTRIVTAENQSRMFAGAHLLCGTVLVDGFVGARWRVTRERASATMIIEPFARMRKDDRTSLAEEGLRLLSFVASDAGRHDIRFAVK